MTVKHTNTQWLAGVCSALMMGSAMAGQPVQVEQLQLNPDLCADSFTPAERDWSFSLSSGWSSKYVTEGLDCLPGSGIWEVAPSISWKDWTLSAWYAGGDSANYDELDLVLGYQWQLGKWTIAPWYEHQFYLSQDYNVANPALTVSHALTDWMTVGVETQVKLEHQKFESYYSAFIQLEWSPVENITISPLVRYGYNGGYNVDYADGSNSIDWSLGVTWKFAEHYSLSGSVNYSQAATVLRKRDAGDEFWVGLRLGVEF